ncbi:hypothetical protein GUITHDRAFT_154714 [Guillardia theta CCMP2712]|uniref:Uncharacterized protein n=2 Tax=Guillardia theta TaxID=55529 RepID=L1IQV6_GUITC|nr:hypothetical protein GUITHDRAFT_154714 [Guillardia theta CCMP2712]EKX38462.1 hypothetical protein GUITHDRAFT_154714 [Guillardia theta CCMP2712]|eukprot:XP_005825442.1 hypothetical protein GUITHDRAFT_154714 [Guillardia theta CCMP2712]
MIPEEMSKAIIRHVEQLEHDEDYFQLDEQSWDVVRVCGLLIHFLCRRRDESCLSPDDNLAQLNRQSLQDKTSCTSVITFEAAEKILQGVKEFADDLKKREKLRRQILFDLKVNFDKERNQLESVIRLKEQQLVSRDDVKQRKKLDVGKNIDKIYKSLLENSGQSPRSSQGELGSPRPATRPASDDRISLSPRELESLLTPRRRILEALDKAGASPALVTQVVTAMDRAEKEAVSRGRSPRESYRTSTLRGQEAAGLRLTDDS